MTTVELLTIRETGPDYVRLQGGDKSVRINFADDQMFSKEDSAAFFRGLRGKPAAIPVDDSPFFIGIDFQRGSFLGELRVIPFPFTIASVERS